MRKVFEPMDVILAVLDVRVADESPEERQGGLDSVHHELVEGAPQAHEALVARAAVHDELADKGIVMRGDPVTLVDRRIRHGRRGRPADGNR